jgi:secretion/DNA translocation related TadE-like protein
MSRPERGTVALAVTVVGVLAFVAVLVAAVGGAVADQRRVESAADLAALAAAGALQAGADPCAEARGTARRNGATVVSCRVTGGDQVVLRAERRTRPVLGRSLALTARARAGPVPSR